MGRPKRFTVITPTHNRAHLLPRCIDSVLGQRFDNFEIIIVDDGSTDSTVELLESYAEIDNRVRSIAQPKRGANAARNHGVEIAEGEYVLFLDSDDEARPDWLENLDALITSTSSPSVACCGIEFRNGEGKHLASKQPAEDTKGRSTGGQFNSGTYAIDREVFKTLDGFTDGLPAHQHTEFRIRLHQFLRKHKLRITSTSKILVNAYQHDGPNIRSNTQAKLEATKYILHHHREKFEQRRSLAAWLSSAGGCAAEQKNYREARRYFLEAIQTWPHVLKNYLRFALCFIPVLRRYAWRDTGRMRQAS